MPDMVLASNTSGLSQNIPVAGKAYFEDELAKEATLGSQYPHHVHFASGQKGGLISIPLKSSIKVGEDNTLLLQQRRARESLVNPGYKMYPPGYKMQMVVQEFRPKFAERETTWGWSWRTSKLVKASSSI